MKRFTILKNNFEDCNTIIDVFKSLVGNSVEVNSINDYLVLYYFYDNIVDVKHLFLSLQDILMVSITGYTSCYNNIEEELEIALEIMPSLPSGMFEFKTALMANYNRINNQRVLDFILKSSGIDENFIKGFIECDLNVSRASKHMYVHRNTINYKLDKLKELSDFDLRVFKDAYIIYSLLK